MSYSLRPYQQEAVDATLVHFRRTNDAAVIVLPTGAGKSLVIAELARLARRRILVLTHVKELVEQNHQKYESYGLEASVFSAGLNRKENQQQVVFGSVQSVSRNLDKFNNEFSLVIVDECHRVSLDTDSQYQSIITHLSQYNPTLKILGLTATPYRLDHGWVYQWHLAENRFCTDHPTPFKACIYELPLHYMIDNKYLTPPSLVDAPIAFYDFESLRTNTNGHHQEDELNNLFKKSRRATAKIIEQVIELSETRQGVMIFAATVLHAKEIIGYLPPQNSALILGSMRATARDSVIHAFKNKQIKYLVNVSVLTTGFDAPHVDLIAILRPTASVGLYQQIIGRGLRLNPDKEDCLILDYAGNTHNLFKPQIDTPKPDSDSVAVEIPCPLCDHTNHFWGKTDNDGDIIEHFGRRCQGISSSETPQPTQCDFRFRFKECGHCGSENDIAARQCHHCSAQLIDPDTKLKEALKLNDAKVIRCSGMSFSIKKKDNAEMLKVCYHDEEGAELAEHFAFVTSGQKKAFQHYFVRHHKCRVEDNYCPRSAQDVIDNQIKYRAPDFVIARKEKHFWTIREKIFDYQGNYRKANQL